MKKLQSIFGIIFAAVLVLSLFTATLPVSASPGENEFENISLPNLAEDTEVGPLAITPDGIMFMAVFSEDDNTWDIVKSTDGGFTWKNTALTGLEDGDGDILSPSNLGAVDETPTDIVISPNWANDESLYVALLNGDIYRLEEGGASFTLLKSIVDSSGRTLASEYLATHNGFLFDIDVWFDGANNWVLAATSIDVLVLKDALFEDWRDQEMVTGSDIAAVVKAAFSPDFAESELIWAVASDDGTVSGDLIVTSTVSPGQWGMEVNDVALVPTEAPSVPYTAFVDLKFPEDYTSDSPVLYVSAAEHDLFVPITTGGNLFKVLGGYGATASEAIPLFDAGDKSIGSFVLSGNTIVACENWGMGTVWVSEDGGSSFTEAYLNPGDKYASWCRVFASPSFETDATLYYTCADFGSHDSALSRSTDGGVTWHQIAMIDTEIHDIEDLAFSPITASQPAMMITDTINWGDSESLWLTADITAENPQWIRVGTGYAYGVRDIDAIEYALDGSCVMFFEDGRNGDPDRIFKSTDNGMTFNLWRTLPDALDDVNDWVIPSGTTVYIAGDDGLFITESFGPVTMNPINSEIEGSYEQIESIDMFDGVIALGDTYGNVYVSTDDGANFTSVNIGTDNVYVAYGPDGTLYAATDDEPVCTVTLKDDGTFSVEDVEDSFDNIVDTKDYDGIWVSPDNTLYVLSEDEIITNATYGTATCSGTINVESESFVPNPNATGSVTFNADSVTVSGTVTVTGDSTTTSIGFSTAVVTLTSGNFVSGENVTYSGSLIYTQATNLIAGTVTVTGNSSGATGTFAASFNANPGNYTDGGNYTVFSTGPNTITVMASTSSGQVTYTDEFSTSRTSSISARTITVTSGNFVQGENVSISGNLTFTFVSGSLSGTVNAHGATSGASGTVYISIPSPFGAYVNGGTYPITSSSGFTANLYITSAGSLYVIDDITTETLSVSAGVGLINGTFASGAASLSENLTYSSGTDAFGGNLSVTAGSPPSGTTSLLNIDASVLTGYYTNGASYTVTDTGSTAVTVHPASVTETISLSDVTINVSTGYFTLGETVTVSGNVTTDSDVNAGTLNVTGANGTGTITYPAQALAHYSVNNGTYAASGTATISGILDTATLTLVSGTNMNVTNGSFETNGASLDVDASVLVATSSTIMEGVIYVSQGANTAEIPVTLFGSGFVKDHPYAITGDTLTVSVPATSGSYDYENRLYRLLIGEKHSTWEGVPMGDTDDYTIFLRGTMGSNILWVVLYDYSADKDTIIAFRDTLSGMTAATSPANGARVTGKTSATLSWDAVSGAEEYELFWMASSGSMATDKVVVSGLEDTSYNLTGLDDNTEYTWGIRVTAPYYGRCSELMTFTTSDAVSAPVTPPSLVPANGAYSVPVKGPAFAWEGVSNLDGYTWQISTDPLFSTTVAEASITTSYYVYTDSLEHSTAYYWRVRAYSDAGGVSEWVTSTFTTAKAPADTIVVENTSPPTITIERPEKPIPSYIWAVVAIGIALITSIIVLLVRTRRV